MQHHQGNPICHIAPSLRLLVPSSPQVRRKSVQVYHHHSRPGVPLNSVDDVVNPGDELVRAFFFLAGRYGRTRSPSVTPIESIRRFWRVPTWLLVSCLLLRAVRSRSSGVAAATIRTLRQVTRRWYSALLPSSLGASVVASAFRSSAACSSATFAFSSSICLAGVQPLLLVSCTICHSIVPG
jgi:hypothetical protein